MSPPPEYTLIPSVIQVHIATSNAQSVCTPTVAPTTPLSPNKTPVSRFFEAQGSPRVWKKQISFSEEDEVVREVGESPFESGSIYSAPSMLSIHSDVGTSKHEDEVR